MALSNFVINLLLLVLVMELHLLEKMFLRIAEN